MSTRKKKKHVETVLRQTLQFLIRFTFAVFAEIGPSFIVVRPFSAQNVDLSLANVIANISSYVFVISARNRHRFYRVVKWQLLVMPSNGSLYW